MSTEKKAYEFNKIGWHALRHKDGWWLGSKEGVHCFKEFDLARMALTAVWQADGGKAVNFRIQTFTGADKEAGAHTFPKSPVQALIEYENKPRKPHEI